MRTHEFDPKAYAAFREAATEYFDFKQCRRKNGTVYGIPDGSKCTAGKEISGKSPNASVDTKASYINGKDPKKSVNGMNATVTSEGDGAFTVAWQDGVTDKFASTDKKGEFKTAKSTWQVTQDGADLKLTATAGEAKGNSVVLPGIMRSMAGGEISHYITNPEQYNKSIHRGSTVPEPGKSSGVPRQNPAQIESLAKLTMSNLEQAGVTPASSNFNQMITGTENALVRQGMHPDDAANIMATTATMMRRKYPNVAAPTPQAPPQRPQQQQNSGDPIAGMLPAENSNVNPNHIFKDIPKQYMTDIGQADLPGGTPRVFRQPISWSRDEYGTAPFGDGFARDYGTSYHGGDRIMAPHRWFDAAMRSHNGNRQAAAQQLIDWHEVLRKRYQVDFYGYDNNPRSPRYTEHQKQKREGTHQAQKMSGVGGELVSIRKQARNLLTGKDPWGKPTNRY